MFNNALASFLLDSACTRSASSGYSISLASRSLVYINSNLQLLTLARTRPTDVMSLSKGHAFLQQKVCQGRHHHFRTQCQQESFGIGSHRHNHNRRNGQSLSWYPPCQTAVPYPPADPYCSRGRPFRIAQRPNVWPWAMPAFPHSSSRASGFFLCGISDDPMT